MFQQVEVEVDVEEEVEVEDEEEWIEEEPPLLRATSWLVGSLVAQGSWLGDCCRHGRVLDDRRY